MTSLVVHSYEGQVIQQRASDGYVNLTQMAKTSDKKVNDYLRLKSTREYLQGLEESTGFPAGQLVEINESKGRNDERGTWAFVEVAIDFAQWVSVPFRIWANRTLRQAMTNEMVVTPPNQVEMMSFNALGKLCSAVGEIGNAMQIIDYDIKKSANEVKASIAASSIETISEVRHAAHSISQDIKELKEIVQSNQAPISPSEFDKYRINIRFKKEQYEQIMKLANASGMPRTAFFREVILYSLGVQP